jgi:hypothetical protein
MTATCTIIEEVYGSVKKIKWDWAADSTGAVSIAAAQTTNVYNGALERLVTVPDGGGAAPSASYDITVLDQDSTDTLMGGGGSRATAATEQVKAASLGVVANDKLKLVVANAGASNAGIAYLYIR